MRVIGHRGAAGLCPENTVTSFRRAVDLGVDVVECDVYLTRDEHLVVLHDATVDRTTNGHGAVADLTLPELVSMRCEGGEHIPTLEEVLDSVCGKAAMAIELKADGAEGPCVDLIRRRGLVETTTFICFALERLVRVRELEQKAVTGALFMRVGETAIDAAREIGANIVDVHFSQLSPELLHQAHAASQEVWIWTVNEEADLRGMMRLGPDGITTDRPDRLRGLLGRAE